MDYKYIEQLLERYWNCQTTLEEERILRSFFSQDDVPAQLLHYKELFDTQREAAEERLGDDFDEKMMNLTGSQAKTVKLAHRTLKQRIMPLIKAVAAVAVVITIGDMAQESMTDMEEETSMAETYVKANEVEGTFSVEGTKATASADSTSLKMPNKMSAQETKK